jgi:hypothetical protein
MTNAQSMPNDQISKIFVTFELLICYLDLDI